MGSRLTDPADRIMAVLNGNTWPTPSHLADQLADLLDRDEFAYTLGKLMDENKVVVVQVDGFTFITTPERHHAYNAQSWSTTPTSDNASYSEGIEQ